jgi:hypothetical protein
VTELVHERATDEARGSGDEHLHRGRVYWRVPALLAATLFLTGCDHSNGPAPAPPVQRLAPRALDAQQQRLVAAYQPVSRALTGYEIAFRDARLGRLPRERLRADARAFRTVVVASLHRLRRAPASGATAQAKTFLVQALIARRSALDALVSGVPGYESRWNRSVVLARRALTTLQDIRDEARLIPLPEDAVS